MSRWLYRHRLWKGRLHTTTPRDTTRPAIPQCHTRPDYVVVLQYRTAMAFYLQLGDVHSSHTVCPARMASALDQAELSNYLG